jgi:hypothetical protein
MCANAGFATASARVQRSARSVRGLARATPSGLRSASPVPTLQEPRAVVPGPIASQQGSARGFLTATFSLSRADVSRIDAGQAVSRTLETTTRARSPH